MSSRSTSKGCGRTASSGRAPWAPRNLRPRSSMLSRQAPGRAPSVPRDDNGAGSASSLGSGTSCAGYRPGLWERRDHRHELASLWAHLPAEEPLDNGNGLRALVDQAAPVQVAGHNAHQGVTDFLLVHDDALFIPKPGAQLLIELRQ